MPTGRAKGELTPKQTQFVRQYLIDRNGKQAAIRAGYSARTAESLASTLLRNPKVRTLVRDLGKAQADRLDILAEEVLRQVYRMAFVDPRRLVDLDSGHPIPLHRLPYDIASAIQGVEVIQTLGGVTFRYRFADRNSAADKLMKHLGLYERDNRQEGDAIANLLSAVHGAGSRLRIR